MKVTLLTVKPANPEAPTVAELNAGIDLSGAVRLGGYSIAGKDLETLGYGAEGVQAIDDYAEAQGYPEWDPTRPPRNVGPLHFTTSSTHDWTGEPQYRVKYRRRKPLIHNGGRPR